MEGRKMKAKIVFEASCGCMVAKRGKDYALGQCSLHAHAEELLDALKKSVDWLEKLKQSGCKITVNNMINFQPELCGMNQLRAAIDKAEGKQ
jgi:hypothetical protein